MSADPLPWSERLRRRNGLPPELAAELADATEQQPDHIRYALVTLTADATAAMRGLNRCAAACERRCPHDLPTTMCHHCQET